MTPLLTQPELEALAKLERSVKDPPDNTGHVYQRRRIALLADRCCAAGPGDLIEIGVYQGGTSVILAQIARQYQRRLICIDNFLAGDDFNLDQIEPRFLAAIEPYRDVVDYLKMDAHHPDTIAVIQARRYCFAFSDDGHSFENHVSELNTLLPVVDGLVAVDDSYLEWVARAIYNTVGNFPGWSILQAPGLGETWVLKQ